MGTTVSTLAKACLDGGVTLLNAGAGNATLKLYNSTTELISFDLGTIGTATDACPSIAIPGALPVTATASAGSETAVDNAELVDGNGTVQRTYASGDIGATGAGRPIELSDTTITSGQTFDLTTFNLRQPCS